jgi:hypothetical protein
MIEQTLRAFCDSRFRWLIVTAGTFVVGLVLILPLVDLYRTELSEKASLLEELVSAQHVAEMMEQFESRVAAETDQLSTLEGRVVNDESLPALRTKLVDLARDTGCSLRRLNVGSMASRPWYQGDNPIVTGAEATAKPADAKTPFTLQWWPVTVSLSGSNANLHNLLDRIDADGMFVHTRNLEVRPASMNRKTLNLDMELWYFNLARGG